MEITEEQRKRSELNRLAALAKRKELAGGAPRQDPWKLFKCRKVSPERNFSSAFPKPLNQPPSCIERPVLNPQIPTQLPHKFRVCLEICSPDSFSATPLPIQGFPFPGEADCLEKLKDCLSNIEPSHYTQNSGGEKACVFKLRVYDKVLRCLKSWKGIDYEEIPWSTVNVVDRLSNSFTSGRWIPCRSDHLTDEKVDELIERLPKSLVDALLPFQLEGVRFGLRRGGRCLIADEMGLGKTLQAIAIAGCFLDEGSVLVVCPAILRYAWAEEFERWLPACLPCDIHLVFGAKNNPTRLAKFPRVVVISYTMLNRLRKSMSEQDWAVLIVDESHHVRCSKKISESEEIKAVLDVARKTRHTVLLSGTPSLSRPYDIFHQIDMLWPGLLGKDKYEFAKTYCSVKYVRGFQGKVFKDFSKGVRLEELNVLLKQSVMIRRLKEHVLLQLPPKRRQIVSLELKRSDIVFAKGLIKVVKSDASANTDSEDGSFDISNETNEDYAYGSRSSSMLCAQQIGIAKLSGFREWLSIHPIIAESSTEENIERSLSSHKMIIFGHYHKVLDLVQEFICGKGIEFVRLDCNTSEGDRQLAVQSFQSSEKVKIALIGIEVGGSGLNLTAANNVVFLELPKDPSDLLQAEDRAHRQGQTKAVNIYIFCAKDTKDESLWKKLNKSLHRVSSTVDGKYDAKQDIEVDSVFYLGTTGEESLRAANPILGRVSSTGLREVKVLELPTTCIDQNLRPGPIDEEENRRYDGQMDNDKYQTQKLVQNEAGIFSSDERFKENASVIDKHIAGRVSSHDEMEGNENKGMVGSECDEKTELRNEESVEVNEAAAFTFLRFEVSQYTGRIHLYTCTPGVDSRPRPLYENLRPEELEMQQPPPNTSNKMAYNAIKNNPKYRQVLLEFIEEWNKLRPIEQRKLLAKPLQLPLSVELCCLNNSLNHGFGGLLKGKSTKRTTSLHEISHPLPVNAAWRKISICSGHGKKEKEYEQGWTMLDEPLCKLCQTPCKGNNARTPEYFEDLFCKLSCYEEYRLRTSNRSLREGLFLIEHGICTNCQLNCHKLVEYIKPLSCEMREKHIRKVAPELAKQPKLLEKLVHEPIEGNAWHADHIVPVYMGGGECKLENMRTLCVVCHARVTAAQCAERRSTRKKARKQLEAVMNDLKDIQNLEQNCAKEKMEEVENILEEDLLIEVPGSAYSRNQKGENISSEIQQHEKSFVSGED